MKGGEVGHRNGCLASLPVAPALALAAERGVFRNAAAITRRIHVAVVWSRCPVLRCLDEILDVHHAN
jgi:hypothetical protein